jgi:hypothetical protein
VEMSNHVTDIANFISGATKALLLATLKMAA